MSESTPGPQSYLFLQAFADRATMPIGDGSKKHRPMFVAWSELTAGTSPNPPGNPFRLNDWWGVFFVLYDVGTRRKRIFPHHGPGDDTDYGVVRLSLFPLNEDTDADYDKPPYAIGDNPHQIPESRYLATQPVQPSAEVPWPELSGTVHHINDRGSSRFGPSLDGKSGYPAFSVKLDSVGDVPISSLAPLDKGGGRNTWGSSVFQLAGHSQPPADAAAYRYQLEWTCTPPGESEPLHFRVDPEMIVRPGT